MTESNAVPGFVPSGNGLHFANSWPSGPTVKLGPLDPRLIGVGDASAGLCGGMSGYVRERYKTGLPIPPDTAAPANGSPLFKAIVRKQVQSLDWLRVPLRFWRFATMGGEALARRTLEKEWPKVRAQIDAGDLTPIGLVRHHGWNPFHLTKDHQVLAHAYDTAGPGGPHTIRLYDPNWPDRDDLTVTLDSTGFRQSTGEPLLGLIHLG
jgi:hypothetical protein